MKTLLTQHFINKDFSDRYKKLLQQNNGNTAPIAAKSQWSPKTETAKRKELFNHFNNRTILTIVSIITLIAAAAIAITAFFVPPLAILAGIASGLAATSIITGSFAIHSHIKYNQLLTDIIQHYVLHARATKGNITRFKDIERILQLGNQITNKQPNLFLSLPPEIQACVLSHQKPEDIEQSLKHLNLDEAGTKDMLANVLTHKTSLNDAEFNYFSSKLTISTMKFINLTHLSINSISSEILQRLNQVFPNLTHLKIKNCIAIQDFDPLRECTNLTDLHLERCSQMQNIDFLQPLVKLTSLHLNNFAFNLDLNNIRHLKELTYLKLRPTNNQNGNGSITNFDALSALTKLTTLSIYDKSHQMININFAQNLELLTHLEITHFAFDLDLNNISRLKELTYLKLCPTTNLNADGSITNFDVLRDLTKLTTLSIYDKFHQMIDISFVQNLELLTHLEIIDCRDISDISPLQNLTQLTDLSLTNCINIQDISPLERLTRLSNLKLLALELEDLSSLRYLVNLTYLNLHLCNKLKLLSPFIHSLTNLTGINLAKCNAIEEELNLFNILPNLQIDIRSNEISTRDNAEFNYLSLIGSALV